MSTKHRIHIRFDKIAFEDRLRTNIDGVRDLPQNGLFVRIHNGPIFHRFLDIEDAIKVYLAGIQNIGVERWET